mmetsp:Transcript_33630/g.84652  ORF Transcript_33630/g.84652 Transcript_33630/m.84652 type:complete len:321 (+) Transcript_33630:599-1561(+)
MSNAPAAYIIRHTPFSPPQSCQMVPLLARSDRPAYWSGPPLVTPKVVNPYRLTRSHSWLKRSTACAPLVSCRHWLNGPSPSRVASVRILRIASAIALLTDMGMAKRGLAGNRRLQAPKISACASGNHIITPVSLTLARPARPSGKFPRQHSATDRRLLSMRSVVLAPMCFSKPSTGSTLKRTTASWLSMYRPYSCSVRCPALPTMAHDLNVFLPLSNRPVSCTLGTFRSEARPGRARPAALAAVPPHFSGRCRHAASSSSPGLITRRTIGPAPSFSCSTLTVSSLPQPALPEVNPTLRWRSLRRRGGVDHADADASRRRC